MTGSVTKSIGKSNNTVRKERCFFYMRFAIPPENSRHEPCHGPVMDPVFDNGI